MTGLEWNRFFRKATRKYLFLLRLISALVEIIRSVKFTLAGQTSMHLRQFKQACNLSVRSFVMLRSSVIKPSMRLILPLVEDDSDPSTKKTGQTVLQVPHRVQISVSAEYFFKYFNSAIQVLPCK